MGDEDAPGADWGTLNGYFTVFTGYSLSFCE